MPPPQNWGAFYASEYNLHPQNKELMNKLIKELKLNVPFDDFPIAPYGNFFWIRSIAIKPLFNKNWTYDDLPGEPIPNIYAETLYRQLPPLRKDVQSINVQDISFL